MTTPVTVLEPQDLLLHTAVLIAHAEDLWVKRTAADNAPLGPHWESRLARRKQIALYDETIAAVKAGIEALREQAAREAA